MKTLVVQSRKGEKLADLQVRAMMALVASKYPFVEIRFQRKGYHKVSWKKAHDLLVKEASRLKNEVSSKALEDSMNSVLAEQKRKSAKLRQIEKLLMKRKVRRLSG